MSDPIDYAALHQAGGAVVGLPQDVRDYVFGSTHPDNITCDFQWVLERLPASVDLRGPEGAIHNQGGNSCVGQSVAWAGEMMLGMRGTRPEISPMFIYYNARRRLADILHQPILDTGTNVMLALGMATTKGMCAEDQWPTWSDPAVEPGPSAYAEALSRLVGRYERCGIDSSIANRNMLADVKVALASGIPVVFCTPLHTDFYGVTGPMSTHRAQYPRYTVNISDPGYTGNHCMTMVGYDDAQQMFIVANSWGSGWGDGGYWGMPYQCLGSVFDVFVMREVDGERFEIPNKYRSTYPTVDSNYGKVYRLYQAAFNRKPDTGGLNYWLGRLNTDLTLRQIAAEFVGSAEFVAMYGPSVDHADFVTLLYANVLKRTPDAGGLAFWVGQMNSGTPRTEVLVQFSESQENKDNVKW